MAESFIEAIEGNKIKNNMYDEYQSLSPTDCSKLIEVLEPQSQKTLGKVASSTVNECEDSGISEGEDEDEVAETETPIQEEAQTAETATKPSSEGDVIELVRPAEEQESLEEVVDNHTIRLKVSSETVLSENEYSLYLHFDRMLLKANAGPSFLKEIRMSGVVESMGGTVGSFRIVLETDDACILKINGRFTVEDHILFEPNSDPNPTPNEILTHVAVCAVSAYLNFSYFETRWSLLFDHGKAQANELVEKGVLRAWLKGPQNEIRRLSTAVNLGKYVYWTTFTIEACATKFIPRENAKENH